MKTGKRCEKFGARHKWEWVKDITLTTTTRNKLGGATHQFKARARYKCECGETRIGVSRGGL
mgnify:CR=1 FL=1